MRIGTGMGLVAAALLAVGCAGKNGHAGHATAAGCPPNQQLEDQLRAMWKVPNAVALRVDSCIVGNFGKTGYYVIAVTQSEDDRDTKRFRTVLDPGGAVIVDASGEDIDFRSDVAAPTLWVVDLDGDGRDEVLEEDEHVEGGVHERWLAGMRIDNGALVKLGEIAVGYDSRNEHIHCDATVEIQAGDGTVVLHAMVSDGTPGDHCLPAGDHDLRLISGKLSAK